jgi:HD superfamily phosphodiesterase
MVDQSLTAGIAVPDTRIAAAATALVLDTTSEAVYHHSRRVYFFGTLIGHLRGLSVDPELLYVAALFHHVGLAARFHHSGHRFEVDGAHEARRFLQGYDVPEDSIRRVWTAIALHTTPGLPEFMEPEVALVAAGVEYDVMGVGFDQIAHTDRTAITKMHPRPDFKRRILEAFIDGTATKPDTTFGTLTADVLDQYVADFRRRDFVDAIHQSSWPE